MGFGGGSGTWDGVEGACAVEGVSGSSFRTSSAASSCCRFSIAAPKLLIHCVLSFSVLHATLNFLPHCKSKISKAWGKGV